MYTQEDTRYTKRELLRAWLTLAVISCALLGLYAAMLILRQRIPAHISLIMLFCAAFIIVDMKILPLRRYERFLYDIETGLKNDMRFELLYIADAPITIDGVSAMEWHVRLIDRDAKDKLDDERILYLNASKRVNIEPGANVEAVCCGRHILSVSEVS